MSEASPGLHGSHKAPEEETRELFKVLDVFRAGERGGQSVVLAGTLASRGVLRWFKDTPQNRRRNVSRALDEGKRVEMIELSTGRKPGKPDRIIVISDVEAVPNGEKIMVDGAKPVFGIDGTVVPAAELLVPDDVIEVRTRGEDTVVSLVDLAAAS